MRPIATSQNARRQAREPHNSAANTRYTRRAGVGRAWSADIGAGRDVLVDAVKDTRSANQGRLELVLAIPIWKVSGARTAETMVMADSTR